MANDPAGFRSSTAHGKPARGKPARGKPAPDSQAPSVLTVGLAVFAVYHLALAAMMAFAPHAFYANVGPFGVRNDHYIRDVATYNAALGVAFAAAVRRPSWRVPVLALTVVQFALHSVNHLVDIGRAHPTWTGYFDFFSLAAATALLVWLLRGAHLEERAGNSEGRVGEPRAAREAREAAHGDSGPLPSSTPERSAT
jgi:hypothetical protein